MANQLWITLGKYTGWAKPGYPEELLFCTQCKHCPSHYPVGCCLWGKKIGVQSVETRLKPCTATSQDKITLKTWPLSYFNDIQGQETKGWAVDSPHCCRRQPQTSWSPGDRHLICLKDHFHQCFDWYLAYCFCSLRQDSWTEIWHIHCLVWKLQSNQYLLQWNQGCSPPQAAVFPGNSLHEMTIHQQHWLRLDCRC